MKRTLASPLVLATLLVAALTGCSTGSTSADTAAEPKATTEVEADAFPVTIEHALGTTTIEAEPTRVVAVGYAEADYPLSLGVVPVGADKIAYAGNENASSDWFDEALAEIDGAEQPTRFSTTDGVPVDEIVKLQPDLVTATQSGMTQEEYDKLTEAGIPVVAYPNAPYNTTWQESLEMVGEALGRSDVADELKAETEQVIADTAAEFPQLEGKTFTFAGPNADPSSFYVYTSMDNRPRLLAELGMVNSPLVEERSEPGQFLFNVSAERTEQLDADVFLTYATSEANVKELADDPLFQQIPAVADNRWYATVELTEAIGLSAPSPLSIPVGMERYIPQVAAAVDGDGSTPS
ncbi:iron-siderophore ABC transporter substrate-binding protein [Nocardioides glacieisoli]|uniref:Iron-siderophore ABC transporter substrate-binding protein n=1 Tax=Nocardioides glacieisoli TaxID=1168730 RepID=A0A4Q2RL93_9ACTN|nr:iron-siderophore ABC transporter substrate-binding protein [Nocardioides glacieisoli]RYB89541.1 iron-siderophore ABC transporter substrate-binding protein [Nocardioides glacieisoli]